MHVSFLFIVVVWLIVLAVIRRRRAADRLRDFEAEVLRTVGTARPPAAPPAASAAADRTLNLGCPACGGRASGTDLSPKGEIKCPYCGTWFDAYR